MEMVKRVLRVVINLLLLLTLVIAIRLPHGRDGDVGAGHPFGAGNAPAEVRSEILAQLVAFQAGYSRRDLDQVDPYLEAVFSGENLLVLGTMPDEVYLGPRKVSRLIYADWNAWGDCRFSLDRAHISSAGDVAWVATVGTVRFDVPRFLVLPLRLSAVMVREEPGWRFQFVQYQFDLTLIALFATGLLLLVWLVANLLSLARFCLRPRVG